MSQRMVFHKIFFGLKVLDFDQLGLCIAIFFIWNNNKKFKITRQADNDVFIHPFLNQQSIRNTLLLTFYPS